MSKVGESLLSLGSFFVGLAGPGKIVQPPLPSAFEVVLMLWLPQLPTPILSLSDPSLVLVSPDEVTKFQRAKLGVSCCRSGEKLLNDGGAGLWMAKAEVTMMPIFCSRQA